MWDQQDRQRRVLVIAVIVVITLIIIGVVWAIIVRQQASAPAPQTANVDTNLPSDKQAALTIAEASNLLNESGQPTLRVLEVTGPAVDWYVVTVENTAVNTEKAQAILKRNGEEVTLVLGPGTAFPEDALAAKEVPIAVREALNVVPTSENR